MSIGDFLDVLSQQILVGTILVGRLGVQLDPSHVSSSKAAARGGRSAPKPGQGSHCTPASGISSFALSQTSTLLSWGWKAVSAAGLQGKGLRRRSASDTSLCFSYLGAVQGAVCSAQCAVRSVQCAVCQCAVCKYAVCSAQCTVQSARGTGTGSG